MDPQKSLERHPESLAELMVNVFPYMNPVCKDWERQLFFQMCEFQHKLIRQMKKQKKT